MKIIRTFKIRVFVIAAALSIGLGFASPAFATYFPAIVDPDGKVTYLGTLNGNENIAADINDSGQVVGFSHPAGNELSRRAFITGPNGVGITDLGTLSGNFSDATGINDSGQEINNLGQVMATISVIPEPTSYALMLAGLGLVGFMVRHRKVAENNARAG